MHEFQVWAPRAGKIAVRIGDKLHPMEGPDEHGNWKVAVESACPGTEYSFHIDDDETAYPDPRSLSQPRGVHGPSVLYNHKAFPWSDRAWQGPPLSGAILYEVHVGTFTREGTFEAAIERLPYLQDLGITHIELMPVAEWAGDRGWGYDGVDMFAATQHYGGPDALKRFVDACHRHSIGVILDVVYNHFGPVGNYTAKFGPYITEVHRTPWGDAMNMEREGSDEVRRFFIDNAIMWMRDFHIDGLRLDAVHEIIDRSAVHFLEQLAAEVDVLSATLGRRLVLIAESDLNDPKIVRPIEAGGYGLDAQWSDDFHHSLATILFTEPGHKGYYDDFGALESLAKSIQDVFVFDGQYSIYRKRSHGRPVNGLSSHHFVGFIQNHDQVGNRALGERIEHCIGFRKSKLALGIVLTAPFLPLLFMGEEFASSSPFLYFADHEDEAMAKLVQEGRKREFADFGFDAEQIPNPEDPETFERSKLDWTEVYKGKHGEMHAWVRSLIHFRRNSPSLNDGDRKHLRVTFHEDKRCLRIDRGNVSIFCNFGSQPAEFKASPNHRIVLSSEHDVSLVEQALTVPPESLAVLSSEPLEPPMDRL